MDTVFDDIEVAPKPKAKGNVFDNITTAAPEPTPVQPAPPSVITQPLQDQKPSPIIPQPQATIGRGNMANVFRHPIEASKLAIGEQYQGSADMLSKNLPEAIQGNPLSPVNAPAKLKSLMGAMGVATAPLAPALNMLENVALTIAFPLLRTANPPKAYDEMVKAGWVTPQSDIENIQNIGRIAGPNRPTTGNRAVDFAVDIATPVPPVLKTARFIKGLVKGTKGAEAARDIGKVAKIETVFDDIKATATPTVEPAVAQASIPEGPPPAIPRPVETPKPIAEVPKPPVPVPLVEQIKVEKPPAASPPPPPVEQIKVPKQPKVTIEPTITEKPTGKIDAYLERESADPMTGEEGILRNEWRIKKVTPDDYQRIHEWFGEKSVPGQYILEHRYIRRGTEEPWTITDMEDHAENLMGVIDKNATAVSPRMKTAKEKWETNRLEKEKIQQGKRIAEDKRVEDKRIREESDSAFDRMLKSPNPKFQQLAKDWNAMHVRLNQDKEFLNKAINDKEFRAAYDPILKTTKVPEKAKAMREFLAKLPEREARIRSEIKPVEAIKPAPIKQTAKTKWKEIQTLRDRRTELADKRVTTDAIEERRQIDREIQKIDEQLGYKKPAGSVGGYTTNRPIPQLPARIPPPLPARTAPKFIAAPQGTALAEAEKITQVEPRKPSLLSKAVQLPKAVQTSLVSEFTPIRTLERNVMEVAGKPIPKVDLSRKFEQVAGAPGQAEADIIAFRRAAIDPIRDIADDFNTYLFLKRTASRLTDNPNIKKVGDWTVEKANNALEELKVKIGDANLARLEEAGKAYQVEMDKALKLQVESGRMTQEVYDKIKASNDFYARFKVMKYIEDAEMAAPGTGRKIATTQDLAKAITGIDEADLSIGNILQASAEQIVRSRILAEKNKKMLELDKLVDLDKTGELIKRAQPTRYYRIEADEAGDILSQLGLQQTARSPQLLEQSFVKVGKAIQFAEESGLKVSRRNLPSSLGRATIGGIQGGGRVNLRAFTSEVISHELGHSFDEKIGSKIKNVFGEERDVPIRLSSAINEAKKINPKTGKTMFGQNEYQKELAGLMQDIGIGGNAKYKASAKERFAAFIDLYIHDPKRAKQIAPTWTEHFETNILPYHQVKSLVEKLSNFYHKVDALPNIMTPLKELDDANYLTTAIRKAFPERAPQIGVRFGTKPKPGNEIVTYFKDGKETAIEVSKEVAQSIQGLNAAQTGILAKVMMMTKTPLQWGATSANAAFQVRNLLFADLPRAALMSRYGIRNFEDLYRFPAEWIYSLFTSVKGNFGHENALYMDWLRSGAANSTIQRSLTPSSFKQTLRLPEAATAFKAAKLPKELVLDNVAKFSNAIEETSKILGLKRGMRLEGIERMNPEAAARKMQDIVAEVRNYSGSPDFARKGRDSTNLNLLFMFFNARMQGAASDIARLTWKTGSKEARDAWIRIGAAIGIPATLLSIWNHTGENKENYDKIPDWEKKNYFMIPTGKSFVNEDGVTVPEYYRIPKREITNILGNLIDSAVEFAAEKDPESFLRFSAEALENISPVNIQGNTPIERLESIVGSTNPLLKTPIEVATGRDTFRHYNAVPDYMKGAPTEEQYRYTTPKPYVALGQTEIAKKLGLSPLHLELMTKSATAGGLSQFTARKPDIGRSWISTNPITKIFVRSGKIDSSKEEELFTEAEKKETAEQLKRRREAERLVREWEEKKLSEDEKRKQIAELKNSDKKLYEKVSELEEAKRKGISYRDRRVASLGVESGARASYIISVLKTLSSDKDRKDYVAEMRRKKILTHKVIFQVRKEVPSAF